MDRATTILNLKLALGLELLGRPRLAPAEFAGIMASETLMRARMQFQGALKHIGLPPELLAAIDPAVAMYEAGILDAAVECAEEDFARWSREEPMRIERWPELMELVGDEVGEQIEVEMLERMVAQRALLVVKRDEHGLESASGKQLDRMVARLDLAIQGRETTREARHDLRRRMGGVH